MTLGNLPQAPSDYVARRIYRSSNSGDGPYSLVAEVNATISTFTDDGSTRGNLLQETDPAQRPRLDASLVVDPSVVVKLDGARIDVGTGAQFLAEVIAVGSYLYLARDNRYGVGERLTQARKERVLDLSQEIGQVCMPKR